MRGLQPSMAWEGERRRHCPGLQGAARGEREATKGACSQETGRLGEQQEESPGMPGIPQTPLPSPPPC